MYFAVRHKNRTALTEPRGPFPNSTYIHHLSAWPLQSLHVLCYLRWLHSKSISTALKISLFNYSRCTSYLSGAVAQKNKKRKGKGKKKKRGKKIRKEKNATTGVPRNKKLFLFAYALFLVTYLMDANSTYMPRRTN